MTDIGAGDHRSVDVDRIARVRDEHDVARIEGREGKMRDALLAADGHDRLGIEIELDTVAVLYHLQMARRSRGMPFETE